MEAFEYAIVRPGSIRVLTIHPESTPDNIRCSLENIPLNQARGDEGFIALSYVWGDPTPVATISVNDHAFEVAKNLKIWLDEILLWQTSGLAQTSNAQGKIPMRFWVDAICINQLDIPERNSQVQQMWRVYTQAWFVLSWLGSQDPDLDAALEAVEQMETSEPSAHDWEQVIGALDRNIYFSRAWITPEVINAKFVLLMCASRVVRWPVHPGICSISHQQIVAGSSRFARLHHVRYHMDSRYDSSKAVYQAIGNMCDKGCTDVRDRIFAVIGTPELRSLDLSIKVDYDLSAIEVYVMVIVASEEVDLTVRDPSPERVVHMAGDHRMLLLNVGYALEISQSELRDWLRRNTNGRTVHLSTGRTLAAGPICSYLLGSHPLHCNPQVGDFASVEVGEVYRGHLKRYLDRRPRGSAGEVGPDDQLNDTTTQSMQAEANHGSARSCVVCEATSQRFDGSALLCCPRCKTAFYCSEDCCTRDWTYHKINCEDTATYRQDQMAYWKELGVHLATAPVASV